MMVAPTTDSSTKHSANGKDMSHNCVLGRFTCVCLLTRFDINRLKILKETELIFILNENSTNYNRLNGSTLRRAMLLNLLMDILLLLQI